MRDRINLTRCPKGHYYNNKDHVECPMCAKLEVQLPDKLQRYGEPRTFAKDSISGVYTLLSKDNKLHTLRILDCHDNVKQLERAHDMITFMSPLQRCDRIIQIIDHEITDDNIIYIIEEYGQPLRSYWEKKLHGAKKALSLGIELCDALIQCREHHIIHLNIKVDNIYIDNSGHLKLGGFSESLFISQINSNSPPCDTPSNIAPEAFPQYAYSERSEIYALGHVLLYLLEKYSAPYIDILSENERDIRHRRYSKEAYFFGTGIPGIQRILNRAINPDPEARFGSYEELKEELTIALDFYSQRIEYLNREYESSESTLLFDMLDSAASPFDDSKSAQRDSNETKMRSKKAIFDIGSSGTSISVESTQDTDSDERDLIELLDAEFSEQNDQKTREYYQRSLETQREIPNLEKRFRAKRRRLSESILGVPYGASREEERAPLANIGRKHESFKSYKTMAKREEYSIERTVNEIKEFQDTKPYQDVHFSVIAPRWFRRKAYTRIEMIMYEKQFRSFVEEAKKRFSEAVQETQSGNLRVAENTHVKVVLTSPDIALQEYIEEGIWFGEQLCLQFTVWVPENTKARQIQFSAMVYFDDVPITRLRFIVNRWSLKKQRIDAIRNDITTAFLSYARRDLDRVTGILQGMYKVRPDMDIFLDVEDLKSGEKWNKRIKHEIRNRDVFYLCWSLAAKKSKWVKQEWQYALKKRGLDYIEPIPLDPPHVCPPPKQLSSKHFNDRLLYLRYYQEDVG